MKKFRVIGLVTLALTVFFGPVFADDGILGLGKISSDLGIRFDSGISQIRSGMNGLRNRNYTGVALGLGRFALTNVPVLSQAYGAGKSFGSLPFIQPHINGMYSAFSTGGYAGMTKYALVGLGASGFSSIPGVASLRKDSEYGLCALVTDKMITAGLGYGNFWDSLGSAGSNLALKGATKFIGIGANLPRIKFVRIE